MSAVIDQLRAVFARFPYRKRGVRPALLVGGLALWLSTGIFTVAQNEQGVVIQFQRVTRLVPAGISVTLPWPIERLVPVRTTEVRTIEIGRAASGESEYRISGDEAQWLTGDINIIEVVAVLQYVVKDPVAYLFRVADLTDGKPRDQILGILAETALTTLLARMEVESVLSSGKAVLQFGIRDRVQELADGLGLGIQIISFQLVSTQPPREVIGAFNDVSSAKADQQRALDDADGYRRDLLPRARAEANRLVSQAEIYHTNVVNDAMGSAHRFKQLAVQVEKTPDVSLRRLWFESMDKALDPARKIVYPRRAGTRFKVTGVR